MHCIDTAYRGTLAKMTLEHSGVYDSLSCVEAVHYDGQSSTVASINSVEDAYQLILQLCRRLGFSVFNGF